MYRVSEPLERVATAYRARAHYEPIGSQGSVRGKDNCTTPRTKYCRECEATNALCNVVIAHVTVITALIPAPQAYVNLWPCNRLQ